MNGEDCGGRCEDFLRTSSSGYEREGRDTWWIIVWNGEDGPAGRYEATAAAAAAASM